MQSQPRKVNLRAAHRCEFIGQQRGSLCLLPFPERPLHGSRHERTATDRRVNLKTASMPANKDGVHIDARPYKANDGFSPGQTILVRVPGLDNPEALRRTAAAPINHIGRYRRSNAPVVVIDARTGQAVADLGRDRFKRRRAPRETLLEIHPGEELRRPTPLHRRLARPEEPPCAARSPRPRAFASIATGCRPRKRVINKRRAATSRTSSRAAPAGHQTRDELYLAWDFTVASDQNIAERHAAHAQPRFRRLGDTDLDDGIPTRGRSPFAIDLSADPATSIVTRPLRRRRLPGRRERRSRPRVRGTFTVPCYLTNGCAPPAPLPPSAPSGNPTLQGSYAANFDCVIPRTAPDAATVPAASRPLLFGHGLLGRATEVIDDPQTTLARAHGFVICATDEIGLSANDIPNTIGILGELGRFPEVTDRTQQGLLNELLLGRLMIHPSGFASSAAFHVDGSDAGSPSTIDPSNLYYEGTSLGGIAGGALTAIAPDFTRVVLGVPAMNFSVLLPRSVDFGTYALVFEPAYPDQMARPLMLDLIQMLWDRSETNGYAHRVTDDPLPEHAAARGADAHRLRRPPGHSLAGGCRSADDRRLRPRPGRLRRTLARRRPTLGDPEDHELPVRRTRRSSTGTAARPAPTRRRRRTRSAPTRRR